MGKAAAKDIVKQGLTLDEYIARKDVEKMSLPKKEQFLHMNINPIELSEDHSFDYSYGYLEKGKIYEKKIHLIVLGESLNNDLIKDSENLVQCVATDTNGELYEVALKGMYIISIRDMRSIYKPKKKKKLEEDE